MSWFPKLLISRQVGTSTEQVLCPVKLREVSLASCRPCPYLHALESDDTGKVEGIICAPSYRALAKVGASD